MNAGAIQSAARNARESLLRRITPAGHWDGHLSSSALSTAVAVAALALAEARVHASFVTRGLAWLAANQGTDGGWGDTPSSPSNLSTTLLCWAAFNHAPAPTQHLDTVAKASRWIEGRIGRLDPGQIAKRVLAAYGKDRTFSVPILTFCALSNRLGGSPEAWESIPQLPFELAALPHQVFKWLRLPVVSYAIPALIAIGLARHENRKGMSGPLRVMREALNPRVLRVLLSMQPRSGGFLEAVPLTGFVVSSLAASGLGHHPVTVAGVEFLVRACRPDGSWPIDVNLNSWVTALSVAALRSAPGPIEGLSKEQRHVLTQWFLGHQHKVEHPFTHAAPGGWGWTSLPGGVPDADDTAGALLALDALEPASPETLDAAVRGIQWLIHLQNRDGGIPTFCRGWSNLPFDRSCPDITAHAVAAWAAWLPRLEPSFQARVSRALGRALDYLIAAQRDDGAWIPLWFGNQHAANLENPLYGTARVLLALGQLPRAPNDRINAAIQRGREWLLQAQHADGGWGGAPGAPSTVEESALALDALFLEADGASQAMSRGLDWLLETTRNGTVFPASPIGLYFAALWYSEELYPVIFTCSALTRAAARTEGPGLTR